MAVNDKRLRIGCCGFRRSRADYAAKLSTVEVQHTFYQPPQVETLKRWREELPPPFEFTLKAWQLITHESRSPTYRRLKEKLSPAELSEAGAFRPTEIVERAWEVTRECAEALDARVVLFQMPASFTPTDEHVQNMQEFFSTIDRGKLQLFWEPRGNWPPELIESLCTDLDLGHTVDPFANQSATPDRIYFRLHGRTGFRYTYEDFELDELVEMIPPETDAYVFFNNVRMIEDAVRLRRKCEI
jgi:uncharacterized protein YecE (DUF72 family)